MFLLHFILARNWFWHILLSICPCNQLLAGSYLHQDWCILFTQHLFIADNETELDESRGGWACTLTRPGVVYSVLLIRPLQIPNAPIGKVWHNLF